MCYVLSSIHPDGSICDAILEGLETLAGFREAVRAGGPECKVFRQGGRMPRVIVVVARERPDLLEYFEKAFTGMADIKVLLDRRLAPPGAESGAAPSRRERRDVYDELQQRGFVMIRLE
jgi:hypothetical protein